MIYAPPREWDDKYTKILLTITISLLALRIVLVCIFGQPWEAEHWLKWVYTSDTRTYVEMSEDLADGDLDRPHKRILGYPLFLLLTKNLLGWTWFGTIILQQIIAAISGLLLVLILIPFLGRLAIWACVFFLIEPYSFFFSVNLQPETVFVFTQILATYLVFKLIGAPLKKYLLLSAAIGAIIAAGVFVHGILMFSFLGFVIFIFLFTKVKLWEKITAAILLVLIVQIPIWAMTRYNYRHFNMKSICTQTSREKCGRFLVIRQLETQGFLNVKAIWNERKIILKEAGYDEEHPDWALRDSVYNDFSSKLIKEYFWDIIKHQFIHAHLFLNLGSQAFKEFVGLTTDPDLESDLSLQNMGVGRLFKVLLGRFDCISVTIYILFAMSYSLILVLSWLLSLTLIRNRQFQPLIYIITGWFFYIAMLIGPLAQGRYRIGFVWALCLSVPIAFYRLKAILFSRSTKDIRSK
ncbi:MAG: hypothetical protein HQ591_07965 [candidate division Zixibacteria bacterium]|nr:hypothetical protein [Candidatus Tariuqbacter arcticus]